MTTISIYHTSDIILAACLRVHGFEMTSIVKEGSKGVFVFSNIPDEFILNYDLGKMLIEPIAFNQMIKTLTTAVRRMP
jgi:hypothetical protein